MNPVLEQAKAEATATKDLSNSGLEEEEEDPEDLESIGADASESATLSKMEDGTSVTPTLMSEEDERKHKLNLARQETAAITRLRILVFSILIISALAVSIIIFKVTKNAQETEFIKQYQGSARLVMDTFTEILATKLGAVSSMGVAITAYSADNRVDWPFMTLSSFQQRAATARKLSGSIYMHINPLVTKDNRKEWEHFVVGNESAWIQEGLDYQKDMGTFDHDNQVTLEDLEGFDVNTTVKPFWPIWRREGIAHVDLDEDEAGPFMPTWQTSPVIKGGLEVNENILSVEGGSNGARLSFASRSVVVGNFFMLPASDPRMTTLLSAIEEEEVEYDGSPVSQVYFPVFDSFAEDRNVVAVMVAWIHWLSYFQDTFPSGVSGIQVVLHNDCEDSKDKAFTFEIDGESVIPMGEGDLHDKSYDSMARGATMKSISNIADGTHEGLRFNTDFCEVYIAIYPSKKFHEMFRTNEPMTMTVAVAVVLVVAVLMFFVYDRLVERRQTLVMNRAIQTNAIVSSLFPANVRDRLMNQVTSSVNSKGEKSNSLVAPSRRLKGYLSGDGNETDEDEDVPIADLFPHCTVMFADISGFTAWSSTREPAQVFILLQTVYQAFDAIAKRRKVFKVETIGDSYVAVTGLPEPQASHAIIMARFAGECLLKMNELVAGLETRLGPDTGDLSMRFGIHSGPVTAGVLKGDRARFQLFGDTVNTAARMESTGIKGKIQASEATYDLLVEGRKEYWITPRADAVMAKGKGILKTFFVNPTAKRGSSVSGSSVSGDSTEGGVTRDTESTTSLPMVPERVVLKTTTSSPAVCLKEKRLVNWITEMLMEPVKQLVAKRPARAARFGALEYKPTVEHETYLDEVAEAIVLPRFSEKSFSKTSDYRKVLIDEEVTTQLREYVGTIAATYNDNPFHNFEHACHVTMSVQKLLKRIVAPDISHDCEKAKEIASKIHAYTHGINSDPLTILAILFSALVHDADHQGISNAQLGKENPDMKEKYHDKSLAEQNSLDIGWNLLMEDRFAALRNCLFTTNAEMKRFRQVLVNVVLATDIFDKELNTLRKNRWNKAFSAVATSQQENTNLRATIVIEHIIQASDVSHTMQHWHIYRKWNKKLFMELYKAYKEGRMEKDPSTFWYKGEIGFFDNYVIPLARKLKECNVFGVSSDECLSYAMRNRNEWKEEGEDILAEMLKECAAAYADGAVDAATL